MGRFLSRATTVVVACLFNSGLSGAQPRKANGPSLEETLTWLVQKQTEHPDWDVGTLHFTQTLRFHGCTASTTMRKTYNGRTVIWTEVFDLGDLDPSKTEDIQIGEVSVAEVVYTREGRRTIHQTIEGGSDPPENTLHESTTMFVAPKEVSHRAVAAINHAIRLCTKTTAKEPF